MSRQSSLLKNDDDISHWLIEAVVFSPNGEYLIDGGGDGVRLWRVEDKKQMARLPTTESSPTVNCLAVSKDGRWIAAGGTGSDGAIVWDATTYEQVLTIKEDTFEAIYGIDFSPDSTRLVVASSQVTCTLVVWDMETRKRVIGPFRTEGWMVVAAKYSPQGDRFATAASTNDGSGSIRVWDSNDGSLLLNIPVEVTSWYNTGLHWFNNLLFVACNYAIKQIDASTGSIVSEYLAPYGSSSSRMVLPQHGEFIAHSKDNTVTFWDASTHTQLGLIEHTHDIKSIAFSPDNQFLAVAGAEGKVTIQNVRDLLLPSYSTVPFMNFTDTSTFDSWKQDRLPDTEASLTEIITHSTRPSHDAFANRALVRAHLRQWDVAIDDAKRSLKIQPSVIGYVAKSVALVGGGQKKEGLRVFDLAFKHCCHPHGVDLLLVIKAVILFMVGEQNEAISRVGDLIATASLNSICFVVQAYMHLLLGNAHMEKNNFACAIQSFEDARALMPYYVGHRVFTISLISGWKIEQLGIKVGQRLCEALYVSGRIKEGAESLLKMVNTFEKEIYANASITEWISGFTQRYLSAPESDNDAAQDNGVAFDSATTSLLREWTKSKLSSGSWKDALVVAIRFTVPRFTIYRAICEHLNTTNQTTDAVDCFHQMNHTLAGDTNLPGAQAEWAADFRQRCAEKLERFGDKALVAQQFDDAIIRYSAALSLNPPIPQNIFIKRSKVYVTKGLWEDALDDTSQAIAHDPSSPWGYEKVLIEWAKVTLSDGSWKMALTTTGSFTAPRITIYRALCERLEIADHLLDATQCFHEMESELGQEPEGEWILDFKIRCCGKLEDLGDAAMNSRQYDEAISHYSAALSFNYAIPQALFVKRSKARATRGLWEDALNDANEVIKLDSSSPLGYERKYVALRGLGRHKDMSDAFEMMLLKLSQSPGPETRVRSHQHARAKEAIRRAIQDAIRESPRVLIHTASGRLYNKPEQAAAFEFLPIFTELISSMTTHVDHARIEQEVTKYYRYVTFSHKWEDNEPLFEKVMNIVVYELEQSPTHDKLKMFCKIVREDGFHWAWSDTCCINKADHFILQEALVAMFKWYQGSAVTIVFLLGVHSPSQRGDLVKSVWNTRAWTFQEYHAAKMVRFYTEDWELYMNIDIPNHKESPEITLEMEEATGVSARALMALRPGLDDIREKLCLASRRETTFVEDAAYSLLGIFSTSLPVVYGEGDKALGRLLAQLLTSSGDTSILAWTGKSGSFNSCLPASNTVFSQLPTSHIPPAPEGVNMDAMTARLRPASPNFALAMRLHDRLNELAVPMFVGQRMKLPCITFKLGPVLASRSGSENVFRAQTAALGIVEIKTEEDLARLDSLYLIHPWIDFLLDRQSVGILEKIADNPSSSTAVLPLFPGPSHLTPMAKQTRTSRFMSRLGLTFVSRPPTPPRDAASLLPPASVTQIDKQVRAMRFVARLRQPFGALLFTPTRQNVAEYRRVASESMITVRVQEDPPLNVLMENVRMLDVL